MGDHCWFPDGRPTSSAAAAVLRILDSGRWPVDEGLAALAASKTRKELEKLAALQFYGTAAANSADAPSSSEEAQETAAGGEESSEVGDCPRAG
jgi:hypothetical protein